MSSSLNFCEIIQKINTMEHDIIPNEIKLRLPLLYKLYFDILATVIPSQLTQNLSNAYNKAYNEHNNKEDVKNKNDCDDQMEQLKNIFEPFKNLSEPSDDFYMTFCETFLKHLQTFMIEDFRFSTEQNKKNEPTFVILNDEELVLYTKEYHKETQNKTVCKKFKNSIDKISELENKEKFTIFDMIKLFSCNECLHSENEHEACKFFNPQGSSFKYVCFDCGCGKDRHAVCDNFEMDNKSKSSSFISDIRCVNCGVNYFSHVEKMKHTSYPCKNYENNGARICKKCKFDDHMHINSVSFNLLPYELQRVIGDHYFIITANGMTTSSMDTLSVSEYIAKLIKVENYKDKAKNSLNI
jgi:hypothetical protein